jgi:predicted  nucleic acid-binding Zn-ribbon protein
MAVTIPVATVYGQAQSDPTLQALLTEVRQLRQALERSAVVAPKIQVTLQRVQLQQDQVARVSRQLEDLRNQTARSTAEETALSTELKATETRLAAESDAPRRQQLEDEMRRLKSVLEQVGERRKMQEAGQTARESELEGRLRSEQSKLDELNDRLNALERALDGPAKQP